MTPADYAIDWALILVVLIQLRERRLTVTSLIRPFVIAGLAVLIYLRGIPTAGNCRSGDARGVGNRPAGSHSGGSDPGIGR
jgi:hypothetical protein